MYTIERLFELVMHQPIEPNSTNIKIEIKSTQMNHGRHAESLGNLN